VRLPFKTEPICFSACSFSSAVFETIQSDAANSARTFEIEIVDDVDEKECCARYRYSDESQATHCVRPLSISRTNWRPQHSVTSTKLIAKYGSAARKRVKSAMHRKKSGTLKRGSGRNVKSRKQAIAFALDPDRSARTAKSRC
jgi:Family of unknown function (DUF6496)